MLNLHEIVRGTKQTSQTSLGVWVMLFTKRLLMTPNDFVQLHGSKKFSHSEELFALITKGECVLSTSGLSGNFLTCRHYLGIYRRHTKHLRTYRSPHAVSMTENCEFLCRELESTPDELCRVWTFLKSPNHIFHVWEGTTTNRIWGCIHGIDKRYTEETTWENLWGEKYL